MPLDTPDHIDYTAEMEKPYDLSNDGVITLDVKCWC